MHTHSSIAYRNVPASEFLEIRSDPIDIGLYIGYRFLGPSRIRIDFAPTYAGGVVGYPRAYYNQFLREFNYHRVHILVGTSFIKRKWLRSRKREREREWSTFDESRRAVGRLNTMRDKNWRHVRGGRRDDTYLWPRLVQKIAEGKTSYELSWKVKVIRKKKKNQQQQ